MVSKISGAGGVENAYGNGSNYQNQQGGFNQGNYNQGNFGNQNGYN